MPTQGSDIVWAATALVALLVFSGGLLAAGAFLGREWSEFKKQRAGDAARWEERLVEIRQLISQSVAAPPPAASNPDGPFVLRDAQETDDPNAFLPNPFAYAGTLLQEPMENLGGVAVPRSIRQPPPVEPDGSGNARGGAGAWTHSEF